MNDQPDAEKEFRDAVEVVAEELDADVFLYAGSMTRGADHTLIDVCPTEPQRANALLILGTAGGDPDVAYRVTRCLQHRYSEGKLILFVDGICKSAGTLVAVGVDALILSDHAELGPLDTQIGTPDEVGEYRSGLVAMQALHTLEEEAFSLFENHFLKLRTKSGFQITTRTAADVASSMVVGLFGPIYGQIDPMRLGENYRAMQVAMMYGERLLRGNADHDRLEMLISAYPRHTAS